MGVTVVVAYVAYVQLAELCAICSIVRERVGLRLNGERQAHRKSNDGPISDPDHWFHLFGTVRRRKVDGQRGSMTCQSSVTGA